MAAHIGHTTRSRRSVKLYLATWALLAVGAVGYLAVLAFLPQAAAPPPQAALDPPRPTVTGESKTVAEVRSMRGSLSEIRKDVTQLKDAVGERVTNEKATQTRLTALEERVSTIDGTPQPPAVPEATPTPTAAAPVKLPEKSAQQGTDRPPASESPVKLHEAVPPVSVSPPPGVVIETGSIASVGAIAPPPKAEIVFGDPVVTPASQTEFSVQLAAAPSLQLIRQSWGQLAEKHAGALAALQPRVVAPRSEGGLYRLLAGPVPTKGDAERICAQLGVGPKACFAAPYAGAPL
jgi:hypothetical protein